VAVQVCLVAVPPALVDEFLADGSYGSLDNEKVKAALEAVQHDARTSVLQAPRLTVFSGQRSTISVVDTQQFVTGCERITWNGTESVIPKFEKIPTGIALSVKPTLSADGQFVQVALKGDVKSIDDSAPPFPVVLTVEPKGSEPLAFTQFVQQPKAQTICVDETFTAPVGHTIVFDAGTRTHAVRETLKTPVLGDVPCLQGLFVKETTRQEEEHVLVLITPRIVSGSK
jgi:general secretion pathway protein D